MITHSKLSSAANTNSMSGYPIIGCLPFLLQNPLQFLSDAARKHGDFVNLGKLGFQQTYLVSHPNDIKYILLDNHQNYCKPTNFTRSVKPIIGEALTVKEGDLWRRQRSLMQPSFHNQRVGAMVNTMTTVIAEMLERWSTVEHGKQLDIFSEMLGLTQKIILKTLFSLDINNETTELLQAWDIVYAFICNRQWNLIKLPTILPTPANRHFKQGMQALDILAYRIIRERRESGNKYNDVLQLLMDMKGDNTINQMSDAELRDEIVAMFGAGFETSASVLAWTWYLLSKYAGVVEKIQSELSAVLGERNPTFEDIPNLKYTKMVVNEVLRLYPGAWSLGRTNLSADNINGYDIPPQSLLFISPYITHRHQSFWENPEGFEPERFSEERSVGRSRYSYLPFGAGPRVCLGETFALTEMVLVVAMVTQRYRLHLVPGHPIEMEAALTLRPRYGVVMKLCTK